MTSLIRSVPLLIGLGLAGIAATTGLASAGDDDLRCDIVQAQQAGMRTITATVTSPRAVTGTYQLDIQTSRNGNTSSVNQGGMFAATAGETVTLGQMSIDAGARTSIDYAITIAGQTIVCSQSAPHRI